jgi:hypothetical protein
LAANARVAPKLSFPERLLITTTDAPPGTRSSSAESRALALNARPEYQSNRKNSHFPDSFRLSVTAKISGTKAYAVIPEKPPLTKRFPFS